jgi:hypothetical protein
MKMQPRPLLWVLLVLTLARTASCSEPPQQQQKLTEELMCSPGAVCRGRRLQQNPMLPPANWTTVEFNVQRGQAFNLSTHIIPGVSIYMVDLWLSSEARTLAMRAQGLLPVCIIE